MIKIVGVHHLVIWISEVLGQLGRKDNQCSNIEREKKRLLGISNQRDWFDPFSVKICSQDAFRIPSC